MAAEARKIYQPIHPSMLARLDPEYIAYHNAHLQYIPSSESIPWSAASRSAPSPTSGASSPVPVGSIRDHSFGGHASLRIFTPSSPKPEKGWPVLIWYHGGGWTMGGLNSENSFLSRVCKDVDMLVVSVDYRHAPENVYPAAIDDAVEGYKWIISAPGVQELGIDVERTAVGGLSAGGGLAAIVSLKCAHLSLPRPKFQLLLLPVIDNTASASTVWARNAHAPWLTPARMTWYRNMYLPNQQDWTNWDVSPNFAKVELLAQSPSTWIAVSECDILCDEGKGFGELLGANGVEAHVEVYEGGTHSLLILDG
ncbi:hypothetical protein BP5796_04921 [Coleophoma crateriformis]|uniref:Alpha/beta hydrolase fold-3 domain-containing protein n=1 Tax=Coleophoma crateriformis TaxID=565419 RepID=A0A3D8SAX1_9HELO|nr:hypothetical protein BP5796_04921 [Coleophoma crateriformis]